MSEMVERVARAIAAANGCSGVDFTPYLPHARAAIEAMREPTEAMKDAHWYNRSKTARHQWEAIIDAALREE